MYYSLDILEVLLLAMGFPPTQRKLYWLRTVSSALKHPFKTEFPWWYSVELGRRLIFLTLTLVIPSTYVSALHSLFACILAEFGKLYTIILHCALLYTEKFCTE